MSTELKKTELLPLGEMHYGRKREQPSSSQLKQFYREAKVLLQHPILWFEEPTREIIGQSLGRAISCEGLTCYACAVLRNHVHLLIRKHRLKDREIVAMLTLESRNELLRQSWGSPSHPIWSDDILVVYKDTPEKVHETIAYINDNFTKHGIAFQNWSFLKPYDGFPFNKLKAR